MSSSGTVQVLVDDFDPRIVYTPTDKWEQGGMEYEHNSTTHGLRDGVGSFSFPFNGTSISVFATTPWYDTEKDAPPQVICKVDGVAIETLTPEGPSWHHHQCRSPTLAGNDVEHVLEVEIDHPGTGPTFHLDYLIYDSEVKEERLVGPGSRDVQIIVDEADPRIEYGGPSGSWEEGGVPREHGGTTHVTETGGATATYKFFGTGIQVFGTLGAQEDKRAFVVTFSIDDGIPISYQSPDLGGLVYKIRFYRSPILEEKEHTLVITDTTEGARPLILDFFLQSVSPASLVDEPDPPGPSESSDPPELPAQNPDDSENTSTDTGPNIGLIAGVTVGAVVLLALLLGLFLWRRRRSKKQTRAHLDLAEGSNEPGVTEPFVRPTPFMANQNASGSQVHHSWVGSSSNSTTTGRQHGPGSSHTGDPGPGAGAGYARSSTHQSTSIPTGPYPASSSSQTYSMYNPYDQNSASYGSASPPQSEPGAGTYVVPVVAPPRPRKGATPPSNPHTPAPVQHMDGGVRLEGEDEEDTLSRDLPPVYQRTYT